MLNNLKSNLTQSDQEQKIEQKLCFALDQFQKQYKPLPLLANFLLNFLCLRRLLLHVDQLCKKYILKIFANLPSFLSLLNNYQDVNISSLSKDSCVIKSRLSNSGLHKIKMIQYQLACRSYSITARKPKMNEPKILSQNGYGGNRTMTGTEPHRDRNVGSRKILHPF